jgi:NAD(P)-dependent dehydrogenase (short-subunit alcohol dehydrogenase family)
MERIDLTGKVAVVIEGAQGIGRIISKALVDQGATVHIITKDLEEAQEVIKEEMFIETSGDERIWRAIASKCCTDNISAVALFINLAKDHHGRVDFVIEPKEVHFETVH